MGSDQLYDKTGWQSGGIGKGLILLELGRVAARAYEQGVTLEEAYAICGAAYGDWREAYEARTRGSFK